MEILYGFLVSNIVGDHGGAVFSIYSRPNNKIFHDYDATALTITENSNSSDVDEPEAIKILRSKV